LISLFLLEYFTQNNSFCAIIVIYIKLLRRLETAFIKINKAIKAKIALAVKI